MEELVTVSSNKTQLHLPVVCHGSMPIYRLVDFNGGNQYFVC